MSALVVRASEYTKGSAVEVGYANALGEMLVKRGRFVLYREAADTLYVEIGGQLRSFMRSRVRYLSPVDEMLHAASFRHGDRVRITKYGGQYTGSVADVFKTRLDVVFTTRGGKVKTQRIPAIECERVTP